MKKQIILFLFASCFFLQAFSAVDLVMSNGGIVPNGMTRGTSYSITVYVSNIGSTSTTTGFYVNLSINNSSTYNGSQTYLTDIFVSGGIAAGQTKTLITTITIPCSYIAGTRYILDGADATNLIPESNETNNNFYFPFLNRNLDTPLPNPPTNITQTSFQANWQTIPEATSYTLLVALNNTFTNILPGYNNVNVGNVTSRVVTGLNCNTNYYYRAQAVNSCGISSAVTSEQIATTSACCAVPNPPTANAASNITVSSFTAHWNTSSGATAYFVDVSTSSTFSNYVYNNQSVGNTTSYNFTGLNCNTLYYYRVRGSSSCGTSNNSSTGSVTTSACCTAPNPPNANAASSITATSFNANWNTSSGTTGYFVDVSTSSTFSSYVYNNQSVGNTTTYNFTGLNCNTQYYYRVRASGSCGTSNNSSTISVSTSACCTAPNPPTANAASSITATSFNANWNTSSGATGYFVDVSTSSTFSSYVYNNQSVGNTTTYNFTGLNCSTQYYYRVRASSGCGTSNNSSTISVNTSACCTAPNPPAVNAASNITASSFTGNWNNSSGATAYFVDVSTSSTFSSYVYNNQSVGNSTSYNFAGLNCNTQYYYRVRAGSSCGTSNNSSTISVITNTCSGTDPSLAIPQQILSPVGTPSTVQGCTCINQSHFIISPYTCQGSPAPAQYGWQFWQRATCTSPPHHGECTGIGINGQCDTKADDRFAWDCNMNMPIFNLDAQQNVYAVAEGYIMNNNDFIGWSGGSAGQLLIKHTNGSNIWYSGYLHFEQITSKKFEPNLANRHVSAGEIIAVVGKTGADNYHLHFAVYYLDPSISTKLRSADRPMQPRLVPASEFRLTSIGSIISGATILLKRDSIWRTYGKTDENGNIQILLMPSIQQGDSLKIIASGYEEMLLGIDSNIIAKRKILIPLMEKTNPSLSVRYPNVQVLNQKTFYDSPIINLKITGKNFSNYDIIRVVDYGDTTIFNYVITNNSIQDSLVNINLVDTGFNNFQIRFRGIDTIDIYKAFNFAPNATSFYKARLNFPIKLSGAALYVDGTFAKKLINSGDSLALLNGTHFLQVQATGYKDSSFIVTATGTVNISLDSVAYSSPENSLPIDFPTYGKIQYRKNVTLMDSSRLSIISLTQFDDSFSGMRLIPKSRKFEMVRLNERWSNIRFVAILDQIENPSSKDVYLLNILDGNKFTKIPFTGSTANYDSIVQKLSYNFINFQMGSSAKEAIAIMKKQPPIITEIPSVTISINDTLKLPLSLFVADPDNIKNDLTITINNISVPSNKFQFSIVDSFVYIKTGNNFTGAVQVNLSATHDFLTVTKVVQLKVLPPSSENILNIYPNPSSATAIADLLLTGEGTYTLVMYDIQGRLVKTIFSNKVFTRGHYIENLKLSNIPAGTYIFKLNDKPTVKFIKMTD